MLHNLTMTNKYVLRPSTTSLIFWLGFHDTAPWIYKAHNDVLGHTTYILVLVIPWNLRYTIYGNKDFGHGVVQAFNDIQFIKLLLPYY